MKFLERFISALIGEEVQFFESEAEVKSAGFKFHGEGAYAAPLSPAPAIRFGSDRPDTAAPRYHGLEVYSQKPEEKPAQAEIKYHGQEVYSLKPEAAVERPQLRYHGEEAYERSVPTFVGQKISIGSAPEPKSPQPALKPDLSGILTSLYPLAKLPTENAPKAKSGRLKAKSRVVFHGEESYTISKVAKKDSVPAPAPDADAAQKQPTDFDAAQEILLKNPGMTGAALIQTMRAMGLSMVDQKAAVGLPNPNAPSVDQQIQSLMLKSPDISGQSLLAAMSSIGIKIVKESDATSSALAVLRGEAEGGKYAHIDFTPPEGARKQARQGLELRKEHGRGGTAVGVARARDLANGKAMSPSTIKRMVSFFARHEVDKKGKGFKSGSEGYPSAGLVAWKLWGGDAGKAWCNKVAAQMDAADKKESSRPSKAIQYTVRDSHFIEASRDDGVGPTKFKVALIQEGLGNLRDCYYYTREALENAASTAAFEGKKCYADHPSASEEQDRPERSVRDIIGHFENVHIEEASDGSAKLVADLIMLPAQSFEWSRTLVASAIRFARKYPDRELVGLSINASGDALPVPIEDFMKNSALPESAKPKLIKAKEMGVTQVRVVSGIKDAISVDLVTEPGCKGKIEEFIEGEQS